MPPTARKKRKPRPAGHTYPDRAQINLLLSDQTIGLLSQLCEARSAGYKARGLDRPAGRLRSEVVTELVHQAAGAPSSVEGEPSAV